jgi:hypothetical protein
VIEGNGLDYGSTDPSVPVAIVVKAQQFVPTNDRYLFEQPVEPLDRTRSFIRLDFLKRQLGCNQFNLGLLVNLHQPVESGGLRRGIVLGDRADDVIV